MYFTENLAKIFPIHFWAKLPDEFHPLGVLIMGMNIASNISLLQKEIDNFATHRAHSRKKKLGSGGPISSLFFEVKDTPHFLWKFTGEIFCDYCNHISKRIIESGSLFSITTQVLSDYSSCCTSAIKHSMSDYRIVCPIDGKDITMKKSIDLILNYYCCTLDYAEDLCYNQLI